VQFKLKLDAVWPADSFVLQLIEYEKELGLYDDFFRQESMWSTVVFVIEQDTLNCVLSSPSFGNLSHKVFWLPKNIVRQVTQISSYYSIHLHAYCCSSLLFCRAMTIKQFSMSIWTKGGIL
jgi:hypothetical protein